MFSERYKMVDDDGGGGGERGGTHVEELERITYRGFP